MNIPKWTNNREKKIEDVNIKLQTPNILLKDIFFVVEKNIHGNARVIISKFANVLNLKHRKLVFDTWYEKNDLGSVFSTDDYFSRVYINSKGGYNNITEDGNLLCKEWYANIGHFSFGVAKVAKKFRGTKFKYNYIDTTGKLISPKIWFEHADDFDDNGAAIKLHDGRTGYINKYGLITLDDDTVRSKQIKFNDINESLIRKIVNYYLK